MISKEEGAWRNKENEEKRKTLGMDYKCNGWELNSDFEKIDIKNESMIALPIMSLNKDQYQKLVMEFSPYITTTIGFVCCARNEDNLFKLIQHIKKSLKYKYE